MAEHLLIKRIVTIESRVDLSSYPDMTASEAVADEEGRSEGDKYEAFVEALSVGDTATQNVRMQEEVVIVPGPIPGPEGVMPGQG